MSRRDPDRALWERLRRHEADAVGDLMQCYSRLLAYVIRGNLGPCSGEDVADVLGRVLFAVWTDIAEYDPRRAQFRTWLVMKARSEARSWRRKQKFDGPFPALPPDDFPLLCEEALQRADLTIALTNLSELDRLIVYLCDLLGHDREAVAAELGLTRGALNTRLHRIRKRLRYALSERLPTSPRRRL